MSLPRQQVPRPAPSRIPSPFPARAWRSVVNPANLPAYSGPTGSIEGTVLVQGPDAPDTPNLNVKRCPGALDTYGKLFRAGPARQDGARPLADALVITIGYEGAYLPEKDDAVRIMVTANCAYPSRTIALTFGQRLEITNDSNLAFAPYLDGTFQPAVMVAPPHQAGEPVKIFPPRADYFALRDRMEPFVRGDVYVLRQRLHAVTDLSGHFRIDGVPTGKMKVGARLAEIDGRAEKDVEIRENVVENVEIVLAYVPAKAAAFASAANRPSKLGPKPLPAND